MNERCYRGPILAVFFLNLVILAFVVSVCIMGIHQKRELSGLQKEVHILRSNPVQFRTDKVQVITTGKVTMQSGGNGSDKNPAQ